MADVFLASTLLCCQTVAETLRDCLELACLVRTAHFESRVSFSLSTGSAVARKELTLGLALFEDVNLQPACALKSIAIGWYYIKKYGFENVHMTRLSDLSFLFVYFCRNCGAAMADDMTVYSSIVCVMRNRWEGEQISGRCRPLKPSKARVCLREFQEPSRRSPPSLHTCLLP